MCHGLGLETGEEGIGVKEGMESWNVCRHRGMSH